MNLNELFKNSKKVIAEGGNVSSQSPGWQGAADQEAEEIDLKIHNRDYMVGQLQELLAAQNESFKAAYGKYIWEPKLLSSGKMFSGSSLQFFDVKGVNTQDFLNKLKKTKVGDIDTQINQDMGEEVTAWLKSIIGKKVGNGTFLGFNSSLSSIWLLDDPQVRIQVDYELGPYDAKTNAPTEWFAYSHSSHYDDMAAGIKGVFHKYINRALSQAQTSTKYVARVLKKGVKISDAPVTDSDYSFAVTSAQGGGMSVKYKPYMDPATGQPMEKDGVPVMQLLDPKDRDYIQNLDQQFQINFNRKRTASDQKLQGSFVGTIQLMNKAFTTEQNEAVARAFLDILFGPGAQMITKDDPERDRDTKFAAVDAMLLGGDGNTPLKVSNGKGMRQEAVDMAMSYADAFKAKAAAKTPLAEAEVKAQLRKGMPHLRDLKPADFLDLIDEIHDGNGRFKLQNIPLNVKIDGFGGRFGKNAEGKPFMGTSRTEPKYQAGFVKYHQEKGTTDPEILGRAANFDKLFNEVMAAIQMVDSKLGADFLVDKQVTCEILFLPFATQTDEGKLKFVGIEYDQLPKNVDLVLVPYRIVDASTGEDIPDGDNIVQQITELGQSGNVMFMSNRLVQNDGLDVTEIINPLDNIEELKQIVSDTAGKRDRASLELRREVEAKLKPVQIALEKAIDEDPNIVGKDMLGQDYEGIVINSRLGPIKVTSQRQKDIISAKNAAKAAARADQGRENANKTAVVAIGSFVGHKGHEELLDYTIKKAESVGGDPYLFIGNAEGKDDPIPPSVKVQTWHKLYPNLANNISTVMQGGSLLQKIKHELINPLPGKPPRYDNIIIMVGEDRATMPIAAALMKAVNKFQGYEHVKVTLEVTPRGTGMSFTKLRNILKDPNATQDQQYAVWAQGFDEAKLGKDWILHLMDITRKGMGIQQPQVQQPAPVVEQRLFNALIRPINEGTSIESTLRAIINDIGEPVTNVYDTMKFQAKKYMENHGELGRGFRMVAAGVGGRWVQNMYFGRLQNELYDLCKYNTRRTVELQQFLRGVESKGELDSKRSFGSIANGLPEILAKIGQHIGAQQLTKNAQRWIQNKAEYEQYIAKLEAEADDDYDEPAQVKPPKSNVTGQQNVQVDQIVNSVLSKLPSKIQGDIRNAIARAPNKLQALQAELQKRGVKAPMAEGLLNEFAPDGFNGGDDDEGFSPEIAKMAQEDGFTKGAGLADGATLERAMAINHWHSTHGGMYKQYFAKGFKAGRMDKIRHNNKQYNLNLKLMKDGSIRHGEQGVAEGAPIVVTLAPIDVRNPKKAPQPYRNQGDIVPDTKPASTEKRGVKGRPGQRPMPTSEGVAVEPDPTGYQKDLLTSPKNALVVDTPGDLDWYKLGQHYPTLGTDDPHEYGQGDSDMVIVPYSEKELAGLKQKLDRLKMRYKDIGGSHSQPEIHDQVEEKIKGADGKACWKGYRYNGTENGKDKCVPISEDAQDIMDVLINKIITNEAISYNHK